MQRSIYLAKLVGPVLLTIGIALVFNAQTYRYMAEQFLVSYALIYLAGVIALVAGLALVNAHNLWTRDWRVVITILGWLSLIGGIVRILVPQEGAIVGTAIVAHNLWPVGPGIVMILLGAWLSYEGYLHHRARPRAAPARVSGSKRKR